MNNIDTRWNRRINAMDLDIESEAFETLRDDFNYVLSEMIERMMSEREQEGTVSVRVKVKLKPTLDQNTGEAFVRPVFAFKTSSNISKKNQAESEMNGDLQVVYDEITSTYKIAYRPSSQLSFEDLPESGAD